MRVLMTTAAWSGHFYPLVPLGWALRAGGHDVRVLCEPKMATVVSESGLPAVGVGHDVDPAQFWRGMNAAPDPDAVGGSLDWEEHRRRRAERRTMMFTGLAEAAAEPILEYARSWRPDVVVSEPTCYAGLLVGQVLGIGVIRHLWGPDSTYLRRDNDPAFLDRLAELWHRYGLDDLRHLGDVTIETGPRSLQTDSLPGSQDARYVPYSGPGQAPDWLLEPAARPRVCLTWSGTFAAAGGHLSPARQIVEALAGTDIELTVVVSEQDRPLLGRVPERVRLVHGLPLELLLPTCSAIIHSGSANVTMAAVATGVPQLIFPAMFDAFVNAERITTAGAGLATEYQLMTPALVRESVATLLGDSPIRAAAAALKAENDALRSPSAVAESLTTLTSTLVA
jgi:UDP:flavonoid glycosyltransferase YjiC (YdhE family)